MSAFELGKPAPYYCKACQAVPQAGYCRMARCPTAPADAEWADNKRPRQNTGNHPEPLGDVFAHRDELLSVLKAIIASENGFYRVAMPSDLREAAREAIAKAEGQ